MSAWTDLIQALAKEPKTHLPPINDLWEYAARIESLESEVERLKSILVAVLSKLDEEEN